MQRYYSIILVTFTSTGATEPFRNLKLVFEKYDTNIIGKSKNALYKIDLINNPFTSKNGVRIQKFLV